ncbi:MAG: hypothetical protein KDB26_06625 [Microthrixaceae bacterium]|nr:hypothetical protein [Microthrixaceae bacterium]
MKNVEAATVKIRKRLSGSWHLDVTGAKGSWPFDVPLGNIASSEIAARFSEIQHDAAELHRWASRSGATIRTKSRHVGGTAQQMPTHICVADIETAAGICGQDWVQRIERGRSRAAALAADDVDSTVAASVIRAFDMQSDVNFELLVAAARWFRDNDGAGLTPRQVPIPGLHAKWLNTNQHHVEALAGRPLHLARPHPARLHFTYLDAGHLAAGGRRYDVATVGDHTHLPYVPRVVLITENKDTAMTFPATPLAVAVEGEGRGGGTVASFDWITSAELVVYWGDIDADGFEILAEYRRVGVPARSMLMDLDTYHRYAPWGTYRWPNGSEIESREPRDLGELTDDERAAYLAVCEPALNMPPRLEQERIPLADAHQALHALVGAEASCRTQ